jgi:uncharacterized protein
VALAVSTHDIHIRDLDQAHDGLKIVHITDVHVGLLTPRARIRQAIEVANEANPDLIFLTGDYVCYGKKFVPVMGEELRGLKARTAVVATLGNHDYWTDGAGVAHELKNNGYDVLKNQSMRFTPRGVPLTVVGIDDAITKRHDVAKSFAGQTSGTKLCLTHCPEMADAAASYGAHLVVAGHTHGGHLHMKNVTERMYRRITKKRYLSGWYDLGDTALYVNRGVGSSSVPIRAGEGARSEVAVFTLRSGLPA